MYVDNGQYDGLMVRRMYTMYGISNKSEEVQHIQFEYTYSNALDNC